MKQHEIKISTLLVDDEPLACEELSFLLKNIEFIEIIGVANTWEEARKAIINLKPQLLLLDIELGHKNGFELLESLSEVPEVIFITAYHQYALQAFEYNALHYLLKPIDEDKLERALEKVYQLFKTKNHFPQSYTKNTLNAESKVFIKDGESCFFVPLKEIYLIESVGNYSRIFFQDKKPFLLKSLNILEDTLPSELFFRVNRRQIINFNFIKNIENDFKSKLIVQLQQGNKIEVSTRQSVRFRELMSL